MANAGPPVHAWPIPFCLLGLRLRRCGHLLDVLPGYCRRQAEDLHRLISNGVRAQFFGGFLGVVGLAYLDVVLGNALVGLVSAAFFNQGPVLF